MKKKQRLAIDDALNSALRPPARKPSNNLNSLLSQYAPAPEKDTPAPRTTPAQDAAPAQNDAEPLHRAAAAPNATPAQQTAVAGFTRIPNDLLDRILPTLDTYDQTLLIRLYRLSRGFNSDTCRVSVPTLAKACNVSERQIRKSIVRLESRSLIQRLEQDFGNKNIALRGTTFRVLITEATPAHSTTPAQQTTPVRGTTPALRAANKLNTQKENTQTQEPSAVVHVGSKFSIEECRKYAKHLQETGQGINNPGGYATTIHRTGEADVLIQAFLNPGPPAPAVDISQCLDCHGTGMYYPEGLGKGGVKKCDHKGLKEMLEQS